MTVSVPQRVRYHGVRAAFARVLMTDVAESDFDLLAAWRGGDVVAGNELVRRHFRTVYRFFRSKLDDEVDDLVQRTFLGAVKSLPGFEGRANFKTFLLGVARNQLLQHLRARGRARGREAGDISVAELGVSAAVDRMLRGREEHRVLLMALRRLPLDLQMTVELYYWERLGVDEVGAILEIPGGTVKSRLARARDNLRQILANLEMDPALRHSTVQDLEGWAKSLRDALVMPDRGGDPSG